MPSPPGMLELNVDCPMTDLDAWKAFAQEFSTLVDEEARVRASVLDHDALNKTLHARDNVVARAASALPGKGPVAEWMLSALDAEEGVTRQFALEVLWRRRHFPRAYLLPVVHIAARMGFRGDRLIQRSSEVHGALATLNAMAETARAGLLGREHARYLSYYVRDADKSAEAREAQRAAANELMALLKEQESK